MCYSQLIRILPQKYPVFVTDVGNGDKLVKTNKRNWGLVACI